MATHSVFLPGQSPWIEEPGGLQCMGSTELDLMIGLSTRVIENPNLWTEM